MKKALLFLFVSFVALVGVIGIYIVTLPPRSDTAVLSETILPTYPTVIASPTPQQRVVYIEQKVDCVGPDGVHFQTTQEKCEEFNEAWGNVPSPQRQQTQSTSYYTSGIPPKIDCSFHSGEYNYDYGMEYADICRMKSDMYFAQKRLEKSTYKAGSYTPDPISVQFHDKPPAPTVPVGYGYN